MALRDVGNFEFLREAIIQKFRNGNLPSLRGIPYEPQSDKNSIFGRIYSTFKELIPKGLNLYQYLNISQRPVLENLYQNLTSDVNLKFLNDPKSVLNDPRFQLSDQYHQEQTPQAAPPQTISLPAQTQAVPAPITTATENRPISKATSAQKISKEEVQEEQPQTKAQNQKARPQEATQSPIQTQTSGMQIPSLPMTIPSGRLSSAPRLSQVSARISSLGRTAGTKIANIAGQTLEGAYPSLGKFGNRLLGGLERIINPQGFGGPGGMGRPRGGASRAFNFGKDSGRNIAKSESFIRKRSGLMFAGLIISMIFLVGALAISGSTQTGEAAPLPGTTPITPSADITSCKFTRSGDSVKELTYKSPLLLSYIQEASNLTGIPPAVFAAFIRVETPSTVTKNDEEIRNLSCAKSTTGALGVMQIQPKNTKGHDEGPVANGARLIGKNYDELTEADYCDVRKNILMGAGFILKKMTYKTSNYPATYGDGTKWDPTWTSDKVAIEKLVSSYYGCLRYGSSDDENISCSDPGRIYSYGDDVWTSIQNCKPASGNVPAPPSDGNYQVSVGKMGINMANGFSADTYKWAFEILTSSFTQFPKFKERLGNSPIEVKPICNISNTSGRVISIRNKKQFCPNLPPDAPEGPTSDPILFKQVFIHELAHIINGSSRPGIYGARIKEAVAQDKGYLTKYAASSTSDPTKICAEPQDANMEDTWADEDFAETISYYINKDTPERDFGCGVYRGDLNPFALTTSAGTRAYEAHYKLAEEVLK